jgi:hypothetical protein
MRPRIRIPSTGKILEVFIFSLSNWRECDVTKLIVDLTVSANSCPGLRAQFQSPPKQWNLMWAKRFLFKGHFSFYVQGDVGPFKAGHRVRVPLWLAVTLRQRHRSVMCVSP